MKNILVADFYKKVPKGEKQEASSAVKEFIEEYGRCSGNIKAFKKGFKVEQIKNTKNKLYKFRVNRGERVVFAYAKDIDGIRDEFKNSIVFIRYCRHNDQFNVKKTKLEGKVIENIGEELIEKEIEQKYENYEYNPNREISLIIEDDEVNDSLVKPNYYLTDEQYEIIIRDIKPLFLFGSAGSGKTVISINKAFAICKNKNIKLKYMTYSKNLVDFSKEVFKEICKRNSEESLDNAEFIEVNRFLLEQSEKSFYIKYEQFQKWYKEQYNRDDYYEIWKEIRGIIKGLVSIEWEEIQIDEKILIDETKEILEAYKLIKGEDKLILNTTILGETYGKIKEHRSYRILKKSMENIYSFLDNYISENKMLSKETYFKLTSKYTIYEIDERERIYKIAEKYNNWLKKNNLVDENDIGRLALKNRVEDLKMFDFLICDEIQDLTEIQIYALLKYTKGIENILFCGDYNQTINPTYFEPGRIEYLYKMNNGLKNFTKRYLSKNYRNSKNVVEMINEITEIRQMYMKHKNDRELEESARQENGTIFILENSEENKRKMLEIGSERHYVGIISSTEEEKEKIEADLNLKDTLFTVNSIKGIERKYIICINLISKYKEAWKNIFEGDNKVDKEKYRIAFNSLYVGITRATETICFIEDDTDNEIYEIIKEHGRYVKEFNKEELYLSKESTREDYYELARELEKEGEYKKAIVKYEVANAEAIDIIRCKGFDKELEGEYEEAGELFLKAREFKLAEEQFRKVKNNFKVIEALAYQNESFDYIREEGEKLNIDVFELLDSKLKKGEWKKKLEEKYNLKMEKLGDKLAKELKNISEIIREISKDIEVLNGLRK